VGGNVLVSKRPSKNDLLILSSKGGLCDGVSSKLILNGGRSDRDSLGFVADTEDKRRETIVSFCIPSSELLIATKAKRL